MTELPVVIVPYDPDWPSQFERERTLIDTIFDAGVTIEHVGSTSVPGLGAKPIIDIMVGVDKLAVAESRIAQMEAADYLYIPEYEDQLPERRYFVRPRQRPRTVHVHCVERTSEFWHRHLAFRDHLRQHPESASEYHKLKQRLAEQHGTNRAAYTEAKSEFVGEVLRKCEDG